MTIETGLSFSPTQDVVIVFDVANYMNGSVITYNPANGAIAIDIQSGVGSGSHTGWLINLD